MCQDFDSDYQTFCQKKKQLHTVQKSIKSCLVEIDKFKKIGTLRIHHTILKKKPKKDLTGIIPNIEP